VLVVALLSLYGLSGRTFNPWWLGSISFEQYVDLMRPWVDLIVGHRAHRHDVCLDAEDLRQDALLVLWTVHQRLADTKPTTDLCRIGTTAVVRKLITLYHQRRGKYRGTVSLESLRDR
jgi:DNA-directed RNA polymerase specialized sigma24 family protein